MLNDEGLILTNAHVVASPIPFECVIDVPTSKGGKDTVTFSRVKMVGVHPTKDLALVQIRPGKYKKRLRVAKISREEVVPGQRVYAIGNPSAAGQVLNKTITSGLLSGLSREIEGVNYYQIDAAINPGNSGGPLVDRTGQVIGIVTLKSDDAENVGFAIPLNDFKESEFIAFEERKSNPQASIEMFQIAVQFSTKAKEFEQEDPNYALLNAYAAYFYQQAILANPSNNRMYFNYGLMMYRLERYDVCIPYVRRSIEMGPWDSEDGRPYWLLGISLFNNGQKEEGRAALEEGTTKYPLRSAQCWEILAACSEKMNDPETAIFAARAELATKSEGTNVARNQEIITRNMQKLSAKERRILQNKTKNLRADLAKREKGAQLHRQRGKKYVLDDFNEFMRSTTSVAEAAKETTSTHELRTWSDRTGKYRVEARLHSYKDGKVTLVNPKGRKLTLPMSRLSAFDQEYVREQTKANR